MYSPNSYVQCTSNCWCRKDTGLYFSLFINTNLSPKMKLQSPPWHLITATFFVISYIQFFFVGLHVVTQFQFFFMCCCFCLHNLFIFCSGACELGRLLTAKMAEVLVAFQKKGRLFTLTFEPTNRAQIRKSPSYSVL